MNCISGSPLNDDQIDTVENGSADDATMQHINECPYCAELVSHAQLVTRSLASLPPRWTCPTPDDIRDFQFNLLEPQHHTDIQHHLTICPTCQQDLTELQDFLTTSASDYQTPQPTFTPKLPPPHAIYPTFVAQSQASNRGVAPSKTPVLRGMAPEPLMFEINQITLFIEIERLSEGIILRGQLIDGENQADWNQALVEAWHNTTVTLATISGDMGMFECRLGDFKTLEIRIISRMGAYLILSNIEYELEP